MKIGDRVAAREPLGCAWMFIPKEAAFEPGAHATVEIVWPSGAGIVQMDGGLRVMVMDMCAKFEAGGCITRK